MNEALFNLAVNGHLMSPEGRAEAVQALADAAPAIYDEYREMAEALAGLVAEFGRGELDPDISTHRPLIRARDILSRI